MGHFFENGANFEILAFFSKNGANFENGAKIENLNCASYARESCAGIRASFRNGTRALNARGYAGFSGGPNFHCCTISFLQLFCSGPDPDIMELVALGIDP